MWLFCDGFLEPNEKYVRGTKGRVRYVGRVVIAYKLSRNIPAKKIDAARK